MNKQFLYMQKLAGLITESEVKNKLNEIESIASKIDQNLDKIKSMPEIQQAAEKVIDDPKLLKQLQQGLSKIGVDLNLMKENKSNGLNISDISKIVSAIQSQADQLQEEYKPMHYVKDDKEWEEIMKKHAEDVNKHENPDKHKFKIEDLAYTVLGVGATSPFWTKLLSFDLIKKVSEMIGTGGTTSKLVIVGAATIIAAIAHYILEKPSSEKKENQLNEKITIMKKSQFIQSLKEIILDEYKGLNEAKKKSKDVAPQKDIEIDLGTEEEIPAEPAMDTTAEPAVDAVPAATGELDIKPEIKTIQDLLQKALANAQQLGDEKLIKQIGNTLTMLVRTQVLGVEKQSMTA